MKILKKYYLLLVVIFFNNHANGQYFLAGEDPASIKWEQLTTEHFKLIYPKSYKGNEQFTANYIEAAYNLYLDSSFNRRKKIPVIIHNQSVYANGFVVWAPKRSEFYTIPSQNTYAQNWIEQLSLHEMKHIAQIKKLDTKFTRVSSYIFGEQAIGVVASLVPRWLYEGDAVLAETNHSMAGRGKMPSFEKDIIAVNLENKKRFTYDQAIYGSYKHSIPNIYSYGYQMVKYGNDKYGDNFWSNAFTNVGKKPYTIIPIYWYLRKNTNLSREKFYNSAYNYYDSLWQGRKSNKINHELITEKQSRFFTSYKYPQFINDSTFIALKESLNRTKEFVAIDLHGNEKLIVKPGLYSGTRFSYNNGKIAWAETVFDYRWGHRTFSCVKLYDLRTKTLKTILRKGHFYSPALSPEGDQLAIIQANANNSFQLQIYNVTNELITSHTFTQGTTIQTPFWLNSKEIIYVSLNDSGKTIEKINIENNLRKVLFNAGYNNISNPVSIGNYIAFNGDFGEKNEIFFIDTSKLITYKIPGADFGSFNPSLDTNGDVLIFENYHSHGYKIYKSVFSEKTFLKYQFQNLYDKENTYSKRIDFKSIKTKDYPTKKYKKYKGLINVHSWAPFLFNYSDFQEDPFNSNLKPGITLLSQNELGTAYGYAGLGISGNGSFMQTSFTYKGFYPVLKMDITYGGKPFISGTSDIPITNLENRYEIDLASYLPFNFTRDRWYRFFNVGINYNFSNDYIFNPINQYWKVGLQSIIYQARLSQYQIFSRLDLMPRIGHVTSINYKHSLNDNLLLKNIYTISHVNYLPGFFKHQHIKLSFQYQKQTPGLYYYPGLISFPRGHDEARSNELTVIKSNYSLPVLYPDFNLAWLFYIKRVKLNVFYDYAKNKVFDYEATKYINNHHYSYGFELTNDMHILRIIFPLDIGIRVSFSKQFERPVNQIILNFSLDGI